VDNLVEHLTADALAAGLDDIRTSPTDVGRVTMIVRRPAVDERDIVERAALDCAVGLVGDTWSERGSSRTPDGKANPQAQLTLMNDRAAALVAGRADRRALAGDQIFVDFDISHSNLPAGTRLAIGSAVIEISEHPHTGCAKFAARFGQEAMRFVNSTEGRELRLRGVNTRVVVAGVVTVGDAVTKVADLTA
jgi:hypothetical protein